ncbi:hypothetical protein [Paenibacillus apiarius]|uniref:hypothetical protein n=1 Tax=Paenibacillus apiarius TaxID=46240 RepID=UPI003B3AFCD9
MEIINTNSGSPVVEPSFWIIILLILGAALGVTLFLAALEGGSFFVSLLGLIIIVIAVTALAGGAANRETGELTPIKYEVLLHESSVIDATKYEVIEQRGKIYVIQEREVSAE